MTDGYVFDDGGRAEVFKGRGVGDCVARAIAIASQRPYNEVYEFLAEGHGGQRITSKQLRGRRSNAAGVRTAQQGIWTKRKWFKDYMATLGFEWTPTMQIGSGCTVHLVADELPKGRLVVAVSKHYTAMIDGVIHDTYDPRREVHCTEPYREPMAAGYWTHDKVSMHHVERRCVYGYWRWTGAA